MCSFVGVVVVILCVCVCCCCCCCFWGEGGGGGAGAGLLESDVLKKWRDVLSFKAANITHFFPCNLYLHPASFPCLPPSVPVLHILATVPQMFRDVDAASLHYHCVIVKRGSLHSCKGVEAVVDFWPVRFSLLWWALTIWKWMHLFSGTGFFFLLVFRVTARRLGANSLSFTHVILLWTCSVYLRSIYTHVCVISW